ncbi:MAG TPA: hypothetical protein PLP08_15555, partial [Plasticicumulans sp.]|nr:hypothetical protein [Plasticicumulans sp.]
MARVAVALSCTPEVMDDLERMARSRSGEVRMAERSRIVLACLIPTSPSTSRPPVPVGSIS